jgi:hypothetical protein
MAETDPQEAVIGALKSFVEDIEVVGIAETRKTWPDLLVTYNAAVEALKGIGRYESDLEPEVLVLDGDLFEERPGDQETVDDIRPLG